LRNYTLDKDNMAHVQSKISDIKNL